MNKDQKLEEIRKACIAANPNKTLEHDCCLTVFPFTLSDVLLAINNHVESMENAQDGNWWNIIIRWNLRKDDLRDQSEETMNFIHSLITGK